MKIKVSVLFSISFLLIAASVQSAPVLRPDVPAGRWKVGYRIVTFRDPERDGRPVQLTVWCPARPDATSPRVLFRTYVDNYFVPETGGAPNPTEREADYSRQTFPDAAKDDVLRLLNSETTSYQDASPTPGKYPVVSLCNRRRHTIDPLSYLRTSRELRLLRVHCAVYWPRRYSCVFGCDHPGPKGS
jgi:hypothetical protein